MATNTQSEFGHLFGHRKAEKIRAYNLMSVQKQARFRVADAHNNIRDIHVAYKSMEKIRTRQVLAVQTSDLNMEANAREYVEATAKFAKMKIDPNFGIDEWIEEATGPSTMEPEVDPSWGNEEWTEKVTVPPTMQQENPLEKISVALRKWKAATTEAKPNPARELKLKSNWIKARKAQEMRMVNPAKVKEYMDNHPISKHTNKE